MRSFLGLVSPWFQTESRSLERIPNQRQRGQVVMCGNRRGELPSRLQNGDAQFARAERGRVLKALLHPVQPKFRRLVVRVEVVRMNMNIVGFDDSA